MTGTSPGQPDDGPVTVYLLDDHELMRCGLRDVLEAAGLRVVGESATAQEATRRIPALRPAVMVLDVLLPDGSGIDVCRRVRSQDPSIHALMLTTYDDDNARAAAAMAGASGFVLKQIRSGNLVDAVRRVAAGERVTDESETTAALTHLTQERDALDLLTRQEGRVLELVAEGLTNAQIGRRLGIGEKTVKNHVTSLLFKLGFERRTQAAVYLTRHRQDAQPSVHHG